MYVRDLKENGKLQFAGSWKRIISNRNSINIFPKNRLSNLFGKTLKASSFEFKPFIYAVDAVDGSNSYDGIEVST